MSDFSNRVYVLHNIFLKHFSCVNKIAQNTKAKYIIISYNNGGIIPIIELDHLLNDAGTVRKIPIDHKTYNRLKGISNYKREKDYVDVKEFLYILKKN